MAGGSSPQDNPFTWENLKTGEKREFWDFQEFKGFKGFMQERASAAPTPHSELLRDFIVTGQVKRDAAIAALDSLEEQLETYAEALRFYRDRPYVETDIGGVARRALNPATSSAPSSLSASSSAGAAEGNEAGGQGADSYPATRPDDQT